MNSANINLPLPLPLHLPSILKTTYIVMSKKFDHENLKVYQLELEFVAWVSELMIEIKKENKEARISEVISQLGRASLSALFNTAEGNGKRIRKGRIKFFDDARGSATECAACLDALVAKKAAGSSEIEPGKSMLYEIVSMLSGLIRYFEGEDSINDEAAFYGRGGDEEVEVEVDEDEDEEVDEEVEVEVEVDEEGNPQ